VSFVGVLVVVAFFFGYFPSEALLAIKNMTTRALAWLGPSGLRGESSLPLSVLPGISYLHELRLQQEGIDNLDNLSHADPVELAIRTRFSLGQLEQWIAEAWMRMHMGKDWQAFFDATGMRDRGELASYLGRFPPENACAAGVEQLLKAVPESLRGKVGLLCTLVCPGEGPPRAPRLTGNEGGA
jgi:hypothetical protein